MSPFHFAFITRGAEALWYKGNQERSDVNSVRVTEIAVVSHITQVAALRCHSLDAADTERRSI